MKPETRKLINNNLGAYVLAQNPEYEWVVFQQDFLAPALMKVARHEINLMLHMPPRHSKSDWGSINFSAWLFGKYPARSNMLLSYSDKFAKRFGRKIINLVGSEVHQEAFPDSRLSATARSASYFAMTGGGEFFSAGFSGTITGQGVNGVLIIDDPAKSMQESRSHTVMSSRMEDYRSSAKTRLEGGSKLLCTTRWCKSDFAERVLDEDGAVEDGGDWTVLSFPAEAGIDDPLERAPGEYLWPSRFGDQWYLNHKRNMRVWMPMFQQDPQPEKGKFFRADWLTYYDKPVRPGRFPTYMIVDPARSKTDSHDRTCILVFCSTPEHRLLLVDAVLERLDPDERAGHMLRLFRKWHPSRTVYEEYGLVNDTYHLEQRYKKEGIRLHPIPIGRKGPRHMLSKEMRIEQLASDFREGVICLPNPEKIGFPRVKMLEADAAEDEISIIDYFVNTEYLEYAGENSTLFDEVLDAMSRLHEPELGIRYPTAASALEIARNTERSRPRRGSWEAVL